MRLRTDCTDSPLVTSRAMVLPRTVCTSSRPVPELNKCGTPTPWAAAAFSAMASPNNCSNLITAMFALLFDLEDYATTYRGPLV
eukprot:27589_4